MPVDQHVGLGTGDRNGQRRLGPEGDPADGRLREGGTRVVADQPVGQPCGRGVEPARARDAEVGVPGPPAVLDRGQRAGLQHRQRPAHPETSTNRTRVPGVSSAGSSRSVSHRRASVRPTRRQPPGRGGRVDPGVLPRQPHGPGRHPGAGPVQPGYRELRRQAAAVGEARREPHERDRELGPAVRGDGLGTCHPPAPGDVVEVGAVVRRRQLDQWPDAVRGPAGRHPPREVVARHLEVGHAVEEHGPGAGHEVRAGQVAAQVGVQERHLGGQRELDQEGVGPGREHLHVTQYSRPALAGEPTTRPPWPGKRRGARRWYEHRRAPRLDRVR